MDRSAVWRWCAAGVVAPLVSIATLVLLDPTGMRSSSERGGHPSPEQVAELRRRLNVTAEPTETWGRDDGLASEEGGMGLSGGTGSRYGVRGPSDVQRQQALHDAAEFGMIGMLGAGAGGDGLSRGNAWGADIAGAGAPAQVLLKDGRYATTYRPGRGHLDAFDAALAQGDVPPAFRQLVPNVGAGFAADVDVPQGRALAAAYTFERGQLPPSGGATHLRIGLASTSAPTGPRPPLSVHLVLDASGSMQGEPIERARLAAKALVERLAPTDTFSMVTFSTHATLVVPSSPIAGRRSNIGDAIDNIVASGGTNLASGLTLAYAEAHKGPSAAEAVRVAFLLSDGRPSAGMQSHEGFADLALQAFQDGTQTTALGLGSDYDGELMSGVAAEGAGGYYYLRNPAQISEVLSKELDQRLDPAALAVEVRIRLDEGVDLLDVYGSRLLDEREVGRVRLQEVASDRLASTRDHIEQDRQDESEGGLRFFIPAFARADRHALLLRVRVPPGVGAGRIGTLELKYKDRIARQNMVDELPLRIEYADSDAHSASSQIASMQRTIQAFGAGRALVSAATKLERGDAVQARAVLTERRDLLVEASRQLAEPALAREADRLAHLLSVMSQPSDKSTNPRLLSMVLSTAGRSRMR